VTRPPVPEEQLAQVWARLEGAVARAKDPFHTPVFGTVQADGGECGLRTVVLRRAEAPLRRLVCHTDLRSSKIADLRRRSRASWLFYDRDARLQVRARGAVTVHTDDDLADEQWRAARLSSRRCYLSEPGPGEVLDGPEVTLPADLAERVPTEAEAGEGRANFAVIACSVDAIDCLMLQYRGHRRLCFSWQEGEWVSRWVAP
jgi:hypothetical protein